MNNKKPRWVSDRKPKLVPKHHRETDIVVSAFVWLLAAFASFIVAWMGGPILLAFAISAFLIWRL